MTMDPRRRDLSLHVIKVICIGYSLGKDKLHQLLKVVEEAQVLEPTMPLIAKPKDDLIQT